MPAVSFRYTLHNIAPSTAFPDGQQVLRPLLRAVITGVPGHDVRCLVCLDTGADRCVFPLSFANRLGLNPSDLPSDTTLGATGAGEVYYSDLSILIPFLLNGQRHQLRVHTRAGFMSGLDAQGIGLLGQIGFFDRYPVIFNQLQGHFAIQF